MGCDASGCQQRECFLVELPEIPGRRKACGVHLSQLATWAHEVAVLHRAAHPEAPLPLVTVAPIPDVTDGGPERGSFGDEDSDGERLRLELDLIAAAAGPGRDETGLIAWTQRAFHRPGYFPPTRGSALAGLILWPIGVALLVMLLVWLKVPVLVTPDAISHAIDDRWYPGARDELVLRSLCCVLLVLAVWMAYFAVMAYWETRPLRASRHRQDRQLTH